MIPDQQHIARFPKRPGIGELRHLTPAKSGMVRPPLHVLAQNRKPDLLNPCDRKRFDGSQQQGARSGSAGTG